MFHFTLLHFFRLLVILAATIPNFGYCQETLFLSNLISILDKPETSIDLENLRLKIEHKFDNSIDIQDITHRIDTIEKIIKSLPEYGVQNTQKLGAILRFIYTPGPWNSYQEYTYDFSDPEGQMSVESGFISRYIKTKKGNCVSMPLLIVFLANRMNVPIKLVRAPMHMYLEYIDEDGNKLNFEATSGKVLSNETYIKNFEISQRSIDLGVYMRPLDIKETAIEIILPILKLARTDQFNQFLALTDKMISINPRNAEAFISKGNLFYLQLNSSLEFYKTNHIKIGFSEKQHLDFLYQQNLKWFQTAESMGWKEPSQENTENYLNKLQAMNVK